MARKIEDKATLISYFDFGDEVFASLNRTFGTIEIGSESFSPGSWSVVNLTPAQADTFADKIHALAERARQQKGKTDE